MADPFASEVTADPFAQPATDPFAAPSESTSQDQTPVSDLIFDAPAPEAPQEQLSPFEAQPQPPVPVEEEPMTVPEPVYVEPQHHHVSYNANNSAWQLAQNERITDIDFREAAAAEEIQVAARDARDAFMATRASEIEKRKLLMSQDEDEVKSIMSHPETETLHEVLKRACAMVDLHAKRDYDITRMREILMTIKNA
eukprot:TRINITY_DN3113_c0_g1_i1.p1 TRINITY_DN3113_c0_g1~~TRINITY_DN3113_c0_g1_i1.p1  ORF type:complete len:197 (-),score=48.19 TRINITY_DN3113_c0_g1_i1:36-626(-)